MTDAMALVRAYHERSKHHLQRYAAGPETLDWDAPPTPWRRWNGAPLEHLPLSGVDPDIPWDTLFRPGAIAPCPLDRAHLARLLEWSLALAAWKQAGPDRWAVRIVPSSGNLHPTEGWLLTKGLIDVADGVHHYAPFEHGLEQRATWDTKASGSNTPPRPAAQAWVALSSIAWREAWKYGERAFRYVQLDIGHATGALRYAAALSGWRLRPVLVDTRALASLLGLDRTDDFGNAETEEAEVLFAIETDDCRAPPLLQPDTLRWFGRPSRLDRHPMYRWPVIDEVGAATRGGVVRSCAQPGSDIDTGAHERDGLPEPRSPKSAAALIRGRRSAQRFDARARMPLAQLWQILQALDPRRMPFDAGPGAVRVHTIVFAHRVDGLTPGAYVLPRSDNGATALHRALSTVTSWTGVEAPPGTAPGLALWQLAENPALAGTLRTLNCHQALGSDAVVGFSMLADFREWQAASDYRACLQEAGLIGQTLYLEAEAVGLAGTGIGCFFDDALHALLGLAPGPDGLGAFQAVYHFTIGQALVDERIQTTPPYAHRSL